MKFNTKGSIFALSMLLILFLSITMVSASDVIADDTSSDISDTPVSDVSVSVGDTDNDKTSFNKLGDSYLADGEDTNGSDVSEGETNGSDVPGDTNGSSESNQSKAESKINAYYNDYCVGNSTSISFNLVADNEYISDAVDVYVNGKYFTTVESSVDYDTYVDITDLVTGNNTINLIYVGNDSYSSAIANFNIISYPKSSEIEYLMDSRVIHGENLRISAFLLDDSGRYLPGNILISIYDEDGNLINSTSVFIFGAVSVPTSELTPYEYYDVVFSYDGNDEYAPCTYSSSFAVLEELETSIEVNHPTYSTSDSFPLYFSLYDENGKIINETVDIYLNDELALSVLSNDEYIPVTLSGLNLGSNTVSLKFNGTRFYRESEYSFNVARYDTETFISIDAPSIVIGKDASVSLNLTDANDNIIDGEIEVVLRENYYGDDESYVPLEETYNFTGNGTIFIESSKLNEGSDYNVFASFKGNLTHSPSEELVSFSVVGRDTEIEIENPYFNDDEEVIANISLMNKAGERISGNIEVTVYDNESKLLFNETVSAIKDDLVAVDIGKLPAGHYIIRAKFNPNHFYNGSESEGYIHVFKKSEIIIETADVYIGQSETINFTLSHSDGALLNETIFVDIFDFKNNKRFYSDYLNLTEGKASIEIENITEDLIIYATYDNDFDMYGPFVTEYSDARQYGVINALVKTTPDATITLEPNGASILATLNDLEGNPIGNAVLNVDSNGDEYNLTTDMSGQASIPAIDGNGTITVKYTDSDNLSVSNQILFISNVKQRIQTKIQYQNMKTATVAAADGRIGKYFEVNLTDASGKPIANKEVKIGFNGKMYNKTTNATGGVRLQINLPRADLYTFALCFLGDDDYNGTFEVALINVTRQAPKLTASAKTFKRTATKTLSATFKTAKGNALSGKSLVFIINGKLYNAKTNSKGVASVKVSLTVRRTYTCTVNSVQDNTFTATSTKFTVKVT